MPEVLLASNRGCKLIQHGAVRAYTIHVQHICQGPTTNWQCITRSSRMCVWRLAPNTAWYSALPGGAAHSSDVAGLLITRPRIVLKRQAVPRQNYGLDMLRDTFGTSALPPLLERASKSARAVNCYQVRSGMSVRESLPYAPSI